MPRRPSSGDDRPVSESPTPVTIAGGDSSLTGLIELQEEFGITIHLT